MKSISKPSPLILGRKNPSKKGQSQALDQGIINERQLFINYDKLYDHFDLKEIQTFKKLQAAERKVTFAKKGIDSKPSEIQQNLQCDLCQALCLKKIIKKQHQPTEEPTKSKKQDPPPDFKEKEPSPKISKVKNDSQLRRQREIMVQVPIIESKDKQANTPLVRSPISSGGTVYYTCIGDQSSQHLSQIENTNLNTTSQ